MASLSAHPLAFSFAGERLQALSGNISKHIRGAAKLDRLSADESVGLSLVVHLDQTLLDQTLEQIYETKAPARRRFLNSAEFAEKFGLAEKRRALKDFARSAGLTVAADEDKPGSLIVKVSGPASVVERAFNVQLHRYRHADGQVFRANAAEPLIPSSMAPHLNAVLGLSNFRGARKPRARGFRSIPARLGPMGLGSATAPEPLNLTGTGPGGGLAPADIKSIYGVSGALTGTGQKVALFELDGYNASDITHYEDNFGIPHITITPVLVDGVSNACGAGCVEVALDIEMVAALSPGVPQILVYEGPNSDQGILDTYDKIATDNLAQVVSTSWGLDEQDNSGSFLSSENQIFKTMAIQGQSIYAASGDCGAYDQPDGGGGCIKNGNPQFRADDPASQPYVTGVGGTSLSGTIGAHTEAVWNTFASHDGGGGGGVSAVWSLPNFQSGIPGMSSQGFRNVPDVSLNSDPYSSPYSIYVNGGWNFVGGTSAAAPLWAALTAQINQRSANYPGWGNLGFANIAIYQLAASGAYGANFNDVTSGNNAHFAAGVGYDDASGWGSFKGDAMINALGVPPTPAAPGGFTVAVQATSSIAWTWGAATNAHSYNIYDHANPATLLGSVNAPTTAFTRQSLTPNTQYNIDVKGDDFTVEGPAGVGLSTYTYALAPSAPSVLSADDHSATIALNCPTPGAGSPCSGFFAQVSANSNFTGTVFTFLTMNSGLTQTLITGLSNNTLYYVRVAALNALGGPNFSPVSSFSTTLSPPTAPTAPMFDQFTTSGLRLSWTPGGNSAGSTFLAQASTAADFSGTLLGISGTASNAVFTGLTADTSYYFRVQAQGQVGLPLSGGPAQATLALPPIAAPSPFPTVSASSIKVAWANNGDQPDTAYLAEISLSANFSLIAASSGTRNTFATFSALPIDALYYARVRAISRSGTPTADLIIGSTATWVQAPTLAGAPITGQETNGFTFNLNGGGNPPGTHYNILVSTDPAFSVLSASVSAASSAASFSGLLSNQLYYAKAKGLNQLGNETSFSAPASTSTLLIALAALNSPVSTRTAATFGFGWGAGTLAPATRFLAQLSSSPVFAFPVISSDTHSASAIFTALQPNTTYYGRVQALSLNAPNPDGPLLSLAASGATLPNPPTATIPAFPFVFVTSMTVAFAPLPLTPSSAAAEGYRVELATSADFSTIQFSSALVPGESSARLLGLKMGTLYYARIGALGWEGLPDYFVAGSTRTLLPPLSSGTVSGAGVVLMLPQNPPLISVAINISGGAFPLGTPVSSFSGFFNTTLTTLDSAKSNEGNIVALGPSAVFCVSAADQCLENGGVQPNSPVRITVAYDPAKIPLSQDERRLQLMRYDPGAGQWTLIASQDDPVLHTLTAFTPHFSVMAPFFVAPSADLSAVQVFPQPWELGDATSAFFSNVLTFSDLPADADVKILTLAGELVWEGGTSAAGVLTWNGNNRLGRRVASGTYYATLRSGGKTKVRRVVLIR